MLQLGELNSDFKLSDLKIGISMYAMANSPIIPNRDLCIHRGHILLAGLTPNSTGVPAADTVLPTSDAPETEALTTQSQGSLQFSAISMSPSGQIRLKRKLSPPVHANHPDHVHASVLAVQYQNMKTGSRTLLGDG